MPGDALVVVEAVTVAADGIVVPVPVGADMAGGSTGGTGDIGGAMSVANVGPVAVGGIEGIVGAGGVAKGVAEGEGADIVDPKAADDTRNVQHPCRWISNVCAEGPCAYLIWSSGVAKAGVDAGIGGGGGE